MNGVERCFVDSNVWLYAFVSGQDPQKSETARELLQQGNQEFILSDQVINEVCVNLIKKAGYAEPDIQSLIESFYAKHWVTPLDKACLIEASELRERYSISFWDSTIVACALRVSATLLLTEDMQDGLVVEGTLRIINPFGKDRLD